jgi:ubiquitin-like protein Pup
VDWETGERWQNKNRSERTRHPDRTSAETEVEVDEAAPATSERGEKIKAELDDLLDEIDEVLEDNAEEFVRNYVQKGGQ